MPFASDGDAVVPRNLCLREHAQFVDLVPAPAAARPFDARDGPRAARDAPARGGPRGAAARPRGAPRARAAACRAIRLAAGAADEAARALVLGFSPTLHSLVGFGNVHYTIKRSDRPVGC